MIVETVKKGDTCTCQQVLFPRFERLEPILQKQRIDNVLTFMQKTERKGPIDKLTAVIPYTLLNNESLDKSSPSISFGKESSSTSARDAHIFHVESPTVQVQKINLPPSHNIK
jgi:hypothetical protein